MWGGERLRLPPWSRAFGALKFSHCNFRPVSSNVPGRGSQWGPLIPVPGLSCRCLEPFPRQASALRGFLAPVQPSSSSSPFLPLVLRAAPSVLAFRWLQTMSLFTQRLGFGGEGKARAQRRRKEGGREASAPVLGQPQLRLKALCGAVWLSAPPGFLREQGLWFVHLPSRTNLQTHGLFQPSLLGISILQASCMPVCRDVVSLAGEVALKDAQCLLDIREAPWASFPP